MNDFIHGRHTGGRAAGTIDDFINGHQGALWMTSSMDAIHWHTGGRATGTMDDLIHGHLGALWMTSSMDATEGGKQKVLVLVQLEPAGNANGKFRY
jgi:hypothetical protein